MTEICILSENNYFVSTFKSFLDRFIYKLYPLSCAGFSDCRVYIETGAYVDYSVDDVTVQEVVEETDIIAEAQEQILENRMSNISVKVQ